MWRRNRRALPVESDRLDENMVVVGALIGLLIGALVGLLNAPHSGVRTRRLIAESINGTGESLRQRIESVVPSDTIGESMAEGKDIARRRREALGLAPADQPASTS